MNALNDPVLKAWLAAVPPFAGLLWFIAWSLRLFPVRFTSNLVKHGVQIILVLAVIGVWEVQISLYRSVSGIRDLSRNHLFTASFVGEGVICLWIIFKSAAKRREKQKNQGA